ncbi:MAG: hypothetical protein AAGA10_23105 [Bacteroidota bacterium]
MKNLVWGLIGLGIFFGACDLEKKEEMDKHFTGPSDREYRVVRIEDSLQLDGTGSDSLWQSILLKNPT